jgi:omega-6 fatty acid desaturase (delta-12 desaturase)
MTPNSAVSPAERRADSAVWKELVTPYQQPCIWRTTWQIVHTITAYVLLWYLMYHSLTVNYWLTLPLVILAGGVLVRIFIIFHDCGHGSLFKSRRANGLVGFITGLLTFTPYAHWRWEHALHHATSGDLDRRGTGAIWTLTVQEYRESSRWRRLAYRLMRHPVILLGLAPLYLFLLKQRFPSPKANTRERRSVWWTNLALVGVTAAMSALFGPIAYLVIQVAVLAVSGAAGVWLFYVQHQFKGVYWERQGTWDYTAAALQGSSFYKLPRILQWFSGNIGFHHIHHLSPRIPNYNLEKCHKSHPMFQDTPALTLLPSLNAFALCLWDEPRRELVGFRHLKESS